MHFINLRAPLKDIDTVDEVDVFSLFQCQTITHSFE
jgi:hypothetical protein